MKDIIAYIVLFSLIFISGTAHAQKLQYDENIKSQVISKNDTATSDKVKKFLVCTDSQIPSKKRYDKKFSKIQDAIHEGETAANTFHVVIDICPHRNTEDLVITSTKTFTLNGLGSGPTLQGNTSNGSVLAIADACGADQERLCYGEVNLNNIHFQKTTAVGDYPEKGLYTSYTVWCSDCKRLDELEINIKNASFDGFPFGIDVKGKTQMNIDSSEFKNLEDDLSYSASIWAHDGIGLGDINTADVEAGFDAELAPNLHVTNTEFFNNSGFIASAYYSQSSLATFENINVHSNDSSCQFMVNGGSTIEVLDSDFHNNDGSVFCLDSTSFFSGDNIVVENNHTTYMGGFLNTTGDAKISNSVIENNTADQKGGAVITSMSTFTSTNTCYSGNGPYDLYQKDSGVEENFGCDDFVCDEDGCE